MLRKLSEVPDKCVQKYLVMYVLRYELTVFDSWILIKKKKSYINKSKKQYPRSITVVGNQSIASSLEDTILIKMCVQKRQKNKITKALMNLRVSSSLTFLFQKIACGDSRLAHHLFWEREIQRRRKIINQKLVQNIDTYYIIVSKSVNITLKY